MSKIGSLFFCPRMSAVMVTAIGVASYTLGVPSWVAYAEVVECSADMVPPQSMMNAGIAFDAKIKCVPHEPDEDYYKLTLFKIDASDGREYEVKTERADNPYHDPNFGFTLDGYHDCNRNPERRTEQYFLELEIFQYHDNDVRHLVVHTRDRLVWINC